MGLFDSVKKLGQGAIDLQLDVIPGIGDARAAERANEQNIKYAKENTAFQERMSNTAYQRAMDDMKKAGLNPMLAFSQGGASAPQGAVPTINQASKSKLGEMAISTATGLKGLGIQQQQADTAQKNVESQTTVNTATTAKTILTNGAVINAPVTFNGTGGSWQLLSNFSVNSTSTVTLTAGTLNLNGFTLTTGLFAYAKLWTFIPIELLPFAFLWVPPLACKLFPYGASVWPDTEENRKIQRKQRMKVELAVTIAPSGLAITILVYAIVRAIHG